MYLFSVIACKTRNRQNFHKMSYFSLKGKTRHNERPKSCLHLKDEERSPGKGSNDEENRALKPILIAVSTSLCRGVGFRVMDVLRPVKINDLSFVKCHQHGSRHCHCCSHHLRLAPDFLHVQLLHPFHPNKCKLTLMMVPTNIAKTVRKGTRKKKQER